MVLAVVLAVLAYVALRVCCSHVAMSILVQVFTTKGDKRLRDAPLEREYLYFEE